MAGVCEQCETQRKELYWNVFPDNKHHFFKIMLGDFRRFLRIPKKFIAEFKGALSRKVVLQGPSGNKWTTTLAQTEKDSVLENGWQRFAKDHSLNDGDFLVFKYIEDSVFQVLIFDPTGCEKEDSHFATPNAESCCLWRNNTAPEKSTASSDEEQSEVRQSKKKKKSIASNDQLHHKCPRKKGKELMQETEEEEEERDSNSDSDKEIQQENEGSEWNNERKWQCSTTYYKSNRRSVTNTDIKRAFRLASMHSTNRPFTQISMKPSHVHHLFILTIPKDFANNCLPQKSEIIMLRVGSKTWPVSLNRRSNQCTLNKGWAKFVLDNNLETEDICVLELAPTRKKKQQTTLDVHIFRVVDEIVPLEVVKPSQAV